MLESKTVSRIIHFISALPQGIARKRHGNIYSTAGDPDIDACIKGRSVQIEVKKLGEKPTPLQFKRLEEWSKAGADAFWCDSFEAFMAEGKARGLFE